MVGVSQRVFLARTDAGPCLVIQPLLCTERRDAGFKSLPPGHTRVLYNTSKDWTSEFQPLIAARLLRFLFHLKLPEN